MSCNVCTYQKERKRGGKKIQYHKAHIYNNIHYHIYKGKPRMQKPHSHTPNLVHLGSGTLHSCIIQTYSTFSNKKLKNIATIHSFNFCFGHIFFFFKSVRHNSEKNPKFWNSTERGMWNAWVNTSSVFNICGISKLSQSITKGWHYPSVVPAFRTEMCKT